MKSIYSFGIFLYVTALRLAAPFNAKAAAWINGRKESKKHLGSMLPHKGKTAWVHCASLGEFEQGRPLIESLKKSYPELRIVLTFFSPSGYETRKNYPLADIVLYLPADLPGAASRFFDAIRPTFGIIIKYEFWQGYLHEAKKRDIPLYLVSGIFRKDMLFFKWYGGFFRKGLSAFAHFFVQNSASADLLAKINLNNVSVSGDTRLDRVLEASASASSIPLIERFKGDALLWVCGSSWPADDALILPLIKKYKGQFKCLLVPHDIHPEYINRLIQSHPEIRMQRFSQADEKTLALADVLILDTMGMLLSAYKYADWAYVGGGFGKAVHNTMEPAVYGIPVMFGPQIHKFNEIQGLISAGGGFCISTVEMLDKQIEEWLRNDQNRKKAGEAARNYVLENAGATAQIMKMLDSKMKQA